MSKFTNSLQYSIDRIKNTAEVVPATACNYPTRPMSGLFVTWLAKQSRRTNQYFQRHRFLASAFAVVLTLALALTTSWGVKRVSADSVSCGINEITFTTGGLNQSPVINSDGTRIAFQSDHDLTGGNPDVNREIFLYDTTTNGFTQVTNTTGGAVGFGNSNP